MQAIWEQNATCGDLTLFGDVFAIFKNLAKSRGCILVGGQLLNDPV